MELFQLENDIFYDETVEGIYILCASGDVYMISDDVGKAIWGLLKEASQTKENMVHTIRGQFSIGSSDPVESDVDEFINVLLKIGVVSLCSNRENPMEAL